VIKQYRPWLPTAILVGIATVIIAFSIWIVPLLGKPAEPGTVPTLAPLWGFNSVDLVRITVARGLQTTTVEREPASMTWRVVAPMPGNADIYRLSNLADGIAALRFTRTLDSVDLAAFGLAEPQATVTLELQDGTTLILKIGDENPARTDYYVQKEGDSKIYLVAASTIGELIGLVDNPPYPATPTPPPSIEQTPTPGESPVETPTVGATETPTVSATGTATPAPTESPVETPTVSAAETKTPIATATATPKP
jgi:hypothetical protein